jgi:Fe-S cluster assembly protein SufB
MKRYVSYLGCTVSSRDENQLHAAVVKLIALDDVEYVQPQNWYPANEEVRWRYVVDLRKT